MNLRGIFTLIIGFILISVSPALWAKPKTMSPAEKTQVEQVVRDYLLNNPEILVEVSRKLQEKQQQKMVKMQQDAQKKIPKIAKELFNDKASPVMGNPNGSVTVVEFFDYQCPHCKDMSPVLEAIVKQNPDVRVVYKEFPIFGNASMFASQAALAANQQGKYKQMHDALMEANNPLTDKKVMAAAKSVGLNIEKLKTDMDSATVRNELEQNLKLSQKLGLLGTPAFVVGHSTKGSNADIPAFFIPGGTNVDILQQYVVQVREAG